MSLRYEAERLAMLLDRGRGLSADTILQDRKLTSREKRRVRQMAEDLRMARVG